MTSLAQPLCTASASKQSLRKLVVYQTEFSNMMWIFNGKFDESVTYSCELVC